jgi:hypothetical protein
LYSFAVPAAAGSLPRPGGEVLLTVTGNIRNTNGEGVAEFDRAMLERLGTTTLQTSTKWTEGRPFFEGVTARALLEAVGARGRTIRAVALNDYVVEIPFSDFRDYPVILALQMDGKYMRVRDKGPIWIIYPHEQYEELQDIEVQDRWIWQLKHLEIR